MATHDAADKWEVEGVVSLANEFIGQACPRVIHASNKQNGRRYMIHLADADVSLLTALARDPKWIPADILRLADTPAAALRCWLEEYGTRSIAECRERAVSASE